MGLNIGALRITSPAFEAEGRIPDRFTKENGNDQPEIGIAGVPEGTVELAIVCHDPDAPLPRGFTHWLVYAVPPDTRVIEENGADAFRVGPNDFGDLAYGGPRPPQGHGLHHYYFWVFALDKKVDGSPTRSEFLERYGEAIIEQNRLVGVYEN